MTTVACESSRVLDRRLSRRRLVAVFAPLVAVACGLGLNPSAVAQTWTNGAGTGLWSNAANWSSAPSTVSRTFDDTAVGSSTADGNNTNISALYIKNTNGGMNTFNLNGGTLSMGRSALEVGHANTGGTSLDSALTLTNGSLTVTAKPEPLYIGWARGTGLTAAGSIVGTASHTFSYATQNNNLSVIGVSESGAGSGAGTLNMSDSDNGSLVLAGGLRAGSSSGSNGATAELSFGDNWTFRFGESSSARRELSVGVANSTGSSTSSFTAGTGGTFTAYLSTFNIGAGAGAGSRSGQLDLSGINDGLIDHSGANGTFNIGRGAGSGSLAVGTGWTMNWNATAAYIGDSGGTGSVTGTNMTLQGAIPYLYVGNSGYGTLDMGGGSMGTGLTISTELRVGFTGDSTGTVKFGSGLVAMNGTANIGDGGTTGLEGLVELRGTMFTAGTSAVVNVNNSGRLNILVSDASSGLILDRANSGALTIADTVAAGNGILATFQNNPTGYNYLATAEDYESIYWAIKWAGNQSSSLSTFLSAGKIGANTSGLTGDLAGATPEVIYDADTDSTYYGIYVTAVPEPGTLALASCGLALAGWSLRRRIRKG